MDERFHRGTEQFNCGQFYEAHESWEELWLEATGNEKLFLQGLIQIAAAYVKAHAGVRSGTIKLLERGAAKVRQAAPAEFAAPVATLLKAVDADLQRAMRAVEPITLADVHPPHIVW